MGGEPRRDESALRLRQPPKKFSPCDLPQDSVRVTYLKIVTYTLLNKGRADRSSNQDEKPKSVTK